MATKKDEIVTAFTKGPWLVEPRHNLMINVYHKNNEKGAITQNFCRVQARDSWVDEAYANAYLISAAPDMFAALKLILSEKKGLSDSAIALAYSVIGKATGTLYVK